MPMSGSGIYPGGTVSITTYGAGGGGGAGGTATITSAPGVWSQVTGGVWMANDPNSGNVVITNATSTAVPYPIFGQTITIPAATTVYAGYGGAISVAPNIIYPPAPPLYAAPAVEDDSLLPRDDLVAAMNPLTLTDENKQAIRGFVMEVPVLARIVDKARKALRDAKEKLRLWQDQQIAQQAQQNVTLQQYAAAAKQMAKEAQQQALAGYGSVYGEKIHEHEAQMKRLFKAQADKLMKLGKSKWISMSPGSRSFASD